MRRGATATHLSGSRCRTSAACPGRPCCDDVRRRVVCSSCLCSVTAAPRGIFFTTATVLQHSGSGPRSWYGCGASAATGRTQERRRSVQEATSVPFLSSAFAASLHRLLLGRPVHEHAGVPRRLASDTPSMLGLHYRFAMTAPDPSLQLKQRAWILIWFGGLAVISLLRRLRRRSRGIAGNEPTSAVALVILSGGFG